MNFQELRNQIKTTRTTGAGKTFGLDKIKLSGKGINKAYLQQVWDQFEMWVKDTYSTMKDTTKVVFNGLGYLASVITLHTYVNKLANKIGELRRKTTRNFHKSIEAHTTKNAGCFKDILKATRSVKSTIREAGKTQMRLGKLASSTAVQEVIRRYTY